MVRPIGLYAPTRTGQAAVVADTTLRVTSFHSKGAVEVAAEQEGQGPLHVSDPDVSVIPMGARCVGREQIRAMVEAGMAQFGSELWDFTTPAVCAAGTVAWGTMDGTVTGRKEGVDTPLGQCHVTFVLEKRGDAWLIAHGHVSAAGT